MIDAIRLTVGNGQSYEQVAILTVAELQRADCLAPFGQHTFGFQHRGKLRFLHLYNVNVIQLPRRPLQPGCSRYERIVLSDDAIYGPGEIVPAARYQAVGVDQLIANQEWFRPFVFTAREGLLVVPDFTVATLEGLTAPL